MMDEACVEGIRLNVGPLTRLFLPLSVFQGFLNNILPLYGLGLHRPWNNHEYHRSSVCEDLATYWMCV